MDRLGTNPQWTDLFMSLPLNKEFVKKSRKHKNMNMLKKEAREDLESLGVEFKRESRSRTFGLCEKGYDQKTHEREERLKKLENDNN